MNILVAGGAGYIGSHTVLELIKNGHNPVIYDAFLTSTDKNLKAIAALVGKEITVIKGDVFETELIKQTITDENVEAIIHFAAYKKAGESVTDPEKYYINNVVGMVNLLSAVRETGINKVVFSSSSSVYGNCDDLPIKEDSKFAPVSPYGESKMIGEMLLRDYFTAYGLSSISLRYFNAAGADESGVIGEEVESTANIIPLIMENLCGRRDNFVLFGDKFNTADGTQERDYIHVTDLAKGHVKALEKLQNTKGCFAYNLGSGVPTSNKKLVELSEKISGRRLNYSIGDPRAGDPERVYADPSLGEEELNWKAEKSIEDIIETAWNWHSNQS